jgi:hypothetical protein
LKSVAPALGLPSRPVDSLRHGRQQRLRALQEPIEAGQYVVEVSFGAHELLPQRTRRNKENIFATENTESTDKTLY